MPRIVRRLMFLPLMLLAGPVYKHFHSTHSWMEGKVRDTVNAQIAPAHVTAVSCNVNGDTADCTVAESTGAKFLVHVSRSGDTWTANFASATRLQ